MVFGLSQKGRFTLNKQSLSLQWCPWTTFNFWLFDGTRWIKWLLADLGKNERLNFRAVWLFGTVRLQSWCLWTLMSGQMKGISYYRYTAERKFKISLRSNFASPSHNRWFRQKNVLNKLYAVWCDRKGDWWQWSSHWAP